MCIMGSLKDVAITVASRGNCGEPGSRSDVYFE